MSETSAASADGDSRNVGTFQLLCDRASVCNPVARVELQRKHGECDEGSDIGASQHIANITVKYDVPP